MHDLPSAKQYVAAMDDRSLRPMGYLLSVLLISLIALSGARLVMPVLNADDTAIQLTTTMKPVVVLSRIVLVVTVVVFLMWFRRARASADSSGWRQRRARGWTFWGWIIPIGNLWIPFQLMGDIWRAGRPPAERTRVAWLPGLWWTSWLLTGLLSSAGTQPRSSRAGYLIGFPHSWLGFGAFAVAGLLLIAITQGVSGGPLEA